MGKTICFFSGDITRSGGTERVSTMIANGLAAQGNYHILFLSLVEQSEELFFALDPSIEHTALGKKWIHPGPGYIRILPKLRRFLKQKKIDIIIDIDIVLDVLSIPAARGLKTKIISWEHFNYDYEMASFYRRCILKYSVKRTDYIVTLTERDSKTYRKNLNRTKNISAIYNPMQELSAGTSSNSGGKAALLHEEGISPEQEKHLKNRQEDILQREKCLITVGRLIPRKGMDYLARVAVPVLKRHPDWKWLLVGDGEEQSFLEDVIEKNQLQDQLILAGRTDDVGSYLARAQIYVMTSRIEGLPMCLLEAKTFCIPSVSFDIPTGPKEIIEDGVNGYLIKPFDCKDMVKKLEQLMEKETLRRQFSEHAQDNLEKFRMEHILGEWNWLLEKL